ncbi:helix-turn-helix domain-containing protein [Photobacterium angustum]|uniref:XRE family transcriptional regulator n=1 Tax=Photobacterium angustum TaxID=661 RepID=A0A855S8A6_PHOAN|nr:helix-turn-helix transcriptional regulator [Photobacterium angustum]KJF79604.1 transcriptional regulator [Photobacterium damselae subsp. damselae]KJG03972.1 transcriptional regulator [Photobacterium angustum]KJG15125.1 transcriptional regulator [Photobacterium angustum]KJG19808.1 transcriptional regulator [Photobacterium angustum]KJG26997.1 transcriptional regulator [Photobacterium angustum]
MIKCHLSAIMGAKRLKIADVVRDAEINRNTVTRLYHETNNRIDFDTLEKLCRYLNCEVGDLLEITDDEDNHTSL